MKAGVIKGMSIGYETLQVLDGRRRAAAEGGSPMGMSVVTFPDE